MGSELRLGLVGTEFYDADRQCIIFMDLNCIVWHSTVFKVPSHILSQWDEPRQMCTHMPLLWLSLFAKCKVLLPSAWLLTLESWPSGSSIIWEGLRNSGSLHLPRPPYQNLSLNSTLRWRPCHWSLKSTESYTLSLFLPPPCPPALLSQPLPFSSPLLPFPNYKLRSWFWHVGIGDSLDSLYLHLLLFDKLLFLHSSVKTKFSPIQQIFCHIHFLFNF